MAEEKKGLSKGCLVALIIVSIILIIIIALSIVCYVKRDSIVEWGLTQITDRTAIEARAALTDSTAIAEFDGLTASFKQALKDKKVPPQEMQSLAMMFQEFWKDKKIDGEEAEKFMETLRSYVAETPPLVPADTI